jgi:hypothetical protein
MWCPVVPAELDERLRRAGAGETVEAGTAAAISLGAAEADARSRRTSLAAAGVEEAAGGPAVVGLGS